MALPTGTDVNLLSSLLSTVTSETPAVFVVHFDNLELSDRSRLRLVGARLVEIHVQEAAPGGLSGVCVLASGGAGGGSPGYVLWTASSFSVSPDRVLPPAENEDDVSPP